MHPYVHAAKTPDKPAYIMAGSGEVVTYKQLEDRSNQMAQYFRSLGLKRGDAIAIFMENNPRYFEICWAAQRSGLYYTAISSRLTAGEVEYIINDCKAQILITSLYKKDVAAQLVPLTGHLKKRLMVDGTIDGYEAYEEARDSMPAERIADESTGADMLYSSGTTGRPKGIRVPLPETPIDEPVALSMLLEGVWGFNSDITYISPAPFYHAAPLRYCMLVMKMGATIIAMENFDAEEALKLIEKHKVTHSQWVPTMFVRMLKLPEEVRKKYDVSSLQVAIHAAAPCPIPVKKQMIEWWGPVIHEYYAGTEGNGFCLITPQEWLTHEGSVGRAVIGELHIVGEDGEENPPGEPGTIFFGNGPQFEYHNDDEKTADSRNDKGWTTLGDVGYVDEEGYLYLTDRKANMIISGGVNIYPQEAENLLVTHPKVADVAVIGVPNEDFGEEVKAVVQLIDPSLANDDTAQELIEFCKAELSAIKCPRSVDFEDELPRHPTGKLYKRLIRDRYWGNRDSKIV